MKPYLAVLYDSFLESIQSKVLWILLIAWTIIIAALFPLALSQGESYAFNNAEILKPKVILDQLAAASAGKGTRAQKAVYAKLDEPFQDTLKQRYSNQTRIPVGLLIESLNRLLKSKDLYDKQAWPTADKRAELKTLIDKENKSSAEFEKLNRGLIDLAFQGSTKSAAGQATWFTYAGIKVGRSLPFTERQIKPFIESQFFPLIIRFGLGIGAMFVAIIITSPMIPDMFQTGSMHLLLSKPLSRSLLFLTKFVGGCTFVAANIMYLLIGLYLYAGIRLDIWNAGILWCIPLFIFTFMIFYSVSALVGLVWKNAIVCVVVTTLFWGICFSVGLIHFFFDLFLHIQGQTQTVYSVGDNPVITTLQGRIQFWDDKNQQWRTAFGEVDGQKVAGPVCLEREKSLYFSRISRFAFGMNAGQDPMLLVCRVPELIDSADNSLTSKIWEDGRLDIGPDLPTDPQQIFPWKDTIGVFTDNGIFRLDIDAANSSAQQKSILSSLNLGLPTKGLAFPSLTQKEIRFSRPMDLCVSPSFQNVLVYSKGRVIRFTENDKKLDKVDEVELGIDEAGDKDSAKHSDLRKEQVATIASNDSVCLVCPSGSTPLVLDVQSLKVRRKLDEIGPETIRQIVVSSDGRFMLLSTEGIVWSVDPAGEKGVRSSIIGQGKVMALHFNESNQLWIAHSGFAVDLWDLENGKSLKAFRPRSGVAEIIFTYIIDPFYQVNPKPSGIIDTMVSLLKNPSNKSLEVDREDLDGPKVTVDPWTPIWSNAAFIVVMLGISCWYLYRQDL